MRNATSFEVVPLLLDRSPFFRRENISWSTYRYFSSSSTLGILQFPLKDWFIQQTRISTPSFFLQFVCRANKNKSGASTFGCNFSKKKQTGKNLHARINSAHKGHQKLSMLSVLFASISFHFRMTALFHFSHSSNWLRHCSRYGTASPLAVKYEAAVLSVHHFHAPQR